MSGESAKCRSHQNGLLGRGVSRRGDTGRCARPLSFLSNGNKKKLRKEAYKFVREIVRKENTVNADLGVKCEFVVHVG